MPNHAEQLAQELNLNVKNVQGAIELIDQGNTIPFIARYRKEATGSMDDQVLRDLGDRLEYLRGLDKRKDEVTSSITEQGAMTPELTAALSKAKTLAEVEDIYRPYKPKRKTRASIAKARGLQPLATAIFRQDAAFDPEKAAADYLNDEVPDAAAALAGAQDIIAEAVSDDAACRAELRRYYRAFGRVASAKAKDEDSVYAQYYDYAEPLNKIPGHRVLALDRGEREGFLKVTIQVDAERAAGIVSWMFARKKTGGKSAELVDAAARDAYSRLIHPSLENELRGELSDAAAEGAIKVFGDNLRQLLLQPPIRGKTVMGLDPGYRMGCKVAVVDPTGKVLDTNVVYPVPEFKRVDQAKKTIKAMVLKNGVEVMAIGNGTAGHETEEFAAEVIRELADEKNLHLQYMVVSEAGASVYSASKLAAEEFPQFDVNLRSAVSIARRLQDPLAELVKIDPKAVGVGQYQHDMPQKRLNETLDGVVEDCVNSVGVDLDTASAPLLRRVAGVSAATAKNIVAWREEEGAFTSRAQLKKVKGLGPKAYEQCAGFLRLPEAKNRLDATAVHPESYAAAKALLDACGYTAAEIGTDKLADLPGVVRAKGAGALCEALGVGEPTLNDIVAELCKPGRDVRDSLPKPLLRSDVMGLDDLKPGMELTGTVRNVIDFGAFVDLGGVDGLIHVSELSWKHIDHPSEVVKVGDKVTVEVLDVDLDRERISLSLKATQEDPWQRFARTHVPGQIVKGKVTKIVQFGVFISVEDGIEGLVHISELANRHVENPETVVKPGEEVFVKVIDVDLDRRRISLSLKQANDSVDPASEDFDPALYGMPAEYDEQGNYKYPEGFDPATNEWIAGYEKQREEWESQYATAHDLWEQHKEFVAKELENAEASAAEDGQAPKEEKVEEVSNYSSDNTSNGTLADSDQLAALRDQLLGK